MIKVQLPALHINEAGSIQNLPIAQNHLGFVSVIYCHANTRRSSHYHKTDTHYLYVVSGQMRYAERKQEQRPSDWETIGAGEAVFTPAMVEHWTEFPVDTVLVSVSRLARDHRSHERDVVRVPWVGEDK